MHKNVWGEREDIKPQTGFNWRPLSNVKLAMELAGSRAGGMETGMEKGGWSRRTQGVRNHCVHWRSNLGRLPAWLREWVSDGVLERGQVEPFVPAAATFQSATDIYTPGLIERLACEPSACTHTPTPPSTHTYTRAQTDTLLSALLPQTQPALTHRRGRPDMLHLWWLPSQQAQNAKSDLWQKCFCQRLNSKFVSGSWYLLLFTRIIWKDAGTWSCHFLGPHTTFTCFKITAATNCASQVVVITFKQ